jgi:sRNA-binding carbon storage regulator CsrA
VIGVKGDKVRLGITAPPAVAVDREEIHERRSEFMGEVELPLGHCSGGVR